MPAPKFFFIVGIAAILVLAIVISRRPPIPKESDYRSRSALNTNNNSTISISERTRPTIILSDSPDLERYYGMNIFEIIRDFELPNEGVIIDHYNLYYTGNLKIHFSNSDIIYRLSFEEGELVNTTEEQQTNSVGTQ